VATIPDGLPLGECAPQDIAREVAEIFDRVSTMIAEGGPAPEQREETVELLARAASAMRAWATFGPWAPARGEEAR
jgi:hypothetical protein